MKTVTPDGRTLYRRDYVSMLDALKDADKGKYNAGSYDLRWAGGLNRREAAEAYRAGRIVSRTTLDGAKRLLDKIDATFRDRDIHSWQPAIAGAYACVPDWLHGRFDSMRVKHKEENDRAPIKVFIESCVSAGVSHDELIKRGTAITALLMRMNEERPVELYTFTSFRLTSIYGKHETHFAIKMDSAPVNITQVLQTFAEPSFLRMLNFNICDTVTREESQHQTTINWSRESLDWATGEKSHTSRADNLRAYWQLDPQDILVERGYLSDAALMGSDPVAWVHAQLEKQRKLDD